MIKDELIGKDIPELITQAVKDGGVNAWQSRRDELKHLLSEHIYGRIEVVPEKVSYQHLVVNDYAFAGKGIATDICFKYSFGQEKYSFNVLLILPKIEKPPVVVFPNFKKAPPDTFLPGEEIIDRGIGVATFYYQDVAVDSKNAFDGGLAKVLSGRRAGQNSAGTISIWSWACSRVADYLFTRQDIDINNLMVIGHSRLGKTALLTGARDDRFKFVFANNAGCAGDSLVRATGGDAEHVSQIVKSFPHWFCPRYNDYADNEENLPVDQHFLISLIAPRFVCCGLAERDKWAGLGSQYLSYVLATPAWQLFGKKGLLHPQRMIETGDSFCEGEAGIYMRPHTHYLSRYDWNKYIDFFFKNN